MNGFIQHILRLEEAAACMGTLIPILSKKTWIGSRHNCRFFRNSLSGHRWFRSISMASFSLAAVNPERLLSQQKRRHVTKDMPLSFGELENLEQDSTAHLDDAVITTAASNFAKIRVVHRSRWRAKVGQVKYVTELTTQLEAQFLMNCEIAEQ